MNKKDIHELKRRLTKHGCTFTRMCGCYVDAEHNKVTNIAETFLNLEEEDFYKYLDIAKKVFSGTLSAHWSQLCRWDLSRKPRPRLMRECGFRLLFHSASSICRAKASNSLLKTFTA